MVRYQYNWFAVTPCVYLLASSAGQIVKFGIRLTAGQLSKINRIFE